MQTSFKQFEVENSTEEPNLCLSSWNLSMCSSGCSTYKTKQYLYHYNDFSLGSFSISFVSSSWSLACMHDAWGSILSILSLSFTGEPPKNDVSPYTWEFIVIVIRTNVRLDHLKELPFAKVGLDFDSRACGYSIYQREYWEWHIREGWSIG